MKTLELKEFETSVDVEGEAQSATVSYKQLIMGALNYIPTDQFGRSQGLPVDEMRLRIRVLDKLDTDEKEIKLDDEDVKVIFDCVKSQKFIAVSQDIVEYYDYVKELHESKGE
jgi:hypothetical protein